MNGYSRIGQVLKLRLFNLIPYRRHSPEIQGNVVVATVVPALEGTEQISGRRPEFGMAKTFAS
uniref:hypothetical protein n=1 Tax=uncultured Clostridium sp. TaxID=59620 RepID=UPI0025D4B02D